MELAKLYLEFLNLKWWQVYRHKRILKRIWQSERGQQ